MSGQVVIFGGNGNPILTEKICQSLGVQPGKILVSQFSDAETRVELQCNVRGADVYIVQPTYSNHFIMEVLIMVDACKRASAGNITLVAPYFGYGRQERKNAPRTPITAKLVADLCEAAGIHRLLTVELHNSAIQGFFKLPVDHLFAKKILGAELDLTPESVVVSPDAGGVERARALAKQVSCGLAIIDKRRDAPNESAVMHIIGNVKDRHCFIVDDIIDTGGSLINAANALLEQGATTVTAAITHPVLSGAAVSRVQESNLTELVVTDTLPLSEKAKNCKKIRQVTISHLLAEAIKRVHYKDSISSLL